VALGVADLVASRVMVGLTPDVAAGVAGCAVELEVTVGVGVGVYVQLATDGTVGGSV
jgi:hypothetical protein